MDNDIVFQFVDERVSARAHLCSDLAPLTCLAILDALPVAGHAHHAIYSGSEIALTLPRLVRVPPEHATTQVHPGDVGFTWFAKGSAHGVDADFAEICWFYDVDATPSMFEGPTPVNVFAKLEQSTIFFTACRRMRTEGSKLLEVRRA